MRYVAILLLALAGAALAQPAPCIAPDGTTYQLVRWHDDGSDRGVYEVLPCDAPAPPTPEPTPDYPVRVRLLPVYR